MSCGKGFGRYSFDHDTVYRTLPSNIETLLNQVNIDKIIMYNREQDKQQLHENIAEAIWKERNKRWSEKKCKQFEFTCQKLLQLIIQNKRKIDEEMFTIIYDELDTIMKQAEKLEEGEMEL